MDYVNPVSVTSIERVGDRSYHIKTSGDQPGRASNRGEEVIRDHPDSRSNANSSPNLVVAVQLSGDQRSPHTQDLLGSPAAPGKGTSPTEMTGRDDSDSTHDSVPVRGGGILDRTGESLGAERE